jgi:large subunit ribosomal protein L23
MPMLDIYDVVKRPLVTERTMRTLDQSNTYAFEVHPRANKIQIRTAVEKLFKVKVLGVRTANVRGKTRFSRAGGRFTRWERPAWKKAYVRLKEGDAIELF